MPTLLELPDAEDCVRLCASLGLRFLELNMNLPQYQPDAVDIERLKRLAERYGVYYTIHLDENFNPFDFNSAVAQAWLETLRRTVRIAAALSAPILNMHLPAGVYFTLPDRRVYLFEAYRAAGVSGAVRERSGGSRPAALHRKLRRLAAVPA